MNGEPDEALPGSWPPLAQPFPNGDPVPDCWPHGLPRGWPGVVGFWAVEPETPWLVATNTTVQHCPDPRTVVQVALSAGTRLPPVAISPFRDRNQSCSDIMGTWSAHAFRVETGSWQGRVVEWRSEYNEPPPATRIRPLEPATPVSFTERVGDHLDRLVDPQPR